jgi:hypothetical protein
VSNARGAEAEAISTATLDRMSPVVSGCVKTLGDVYRPSDGLFPYSSRLAGRDFISDYRRPDSLRYTLNTLLGLGRAARAGIGDLSPANVDAMVETFNRLQADGISDHADLGMLLLLNVDNPDANGTEVIELALRRLRPSVLSNEPQLFNMQELGWIIWGAAAATRAGIAGAEEIGRRATAIVQKHFVHPKTGLPRHSTRPYRKSLVSFGSLTYFLRAMNEAATTFQDERAADLFAAGVRHAISIQGPRGEWPWMIHIGAGTPIDVYPVFSVHQDSMAMLFLLPALDQGEAGVADAIARSVAWCFGENELGAEFYRWEPFSAGRSIERAEGERRTRRYLRFLAYSLTRRSGSFAGARVRVNDECRSYHLGWILYAWAERLTPG